MHCHKRGLVRQLDGAQHVLHTARSTCALDVRRATATILRICRRPPGVLGRALLSVRRASQCVNSFVCVASRARMIRGLRLFRFQGRVQGRSGECRVVCFYANTGDDRKTWQGGGSGGVGAVPENDRRCFRKKAGSTSVGRSGDAVKSVSRKRFATFRHTWRRPSPRAQHALWL